jgi:hypothetical protein
LIKGSVSGSIKSKASKAAVNTKMRGELNLNAQTTRRNSNGWELNEEITLLLGIAENLP